MDEPNRMCSRCQVPMTTGALRTPDGGGNGRGHAWGWNLRARWEGEGGPYRVNAFRCPTCGAVELAATERPTRPQGCLSVVLLLAGVVAGICWAVGRVIVG